MQRDKHSPHSEQHTNKCHFPLGFKVNFTKVSNHIYFTAFIQIWFLILEGNERCLSDEIFYNIDRGFWHFSCISELRTFYKLKFNYIFETHKNSTEITNTFQSFRYQTNFYWFKCLKNSPHKEFSKKWRSLYPPNTDIKKSGSRARKRPTSLNCQKQ